MKGSFCISIVLVCLILTSCSDLFERTYWSEGNYFVQDKPSDPSSKTLYYDMGGDGIGRIDFITKLGANDKFIIAESINSRQSCRKEYWILDKENDSRYLNAGKIVEGPFAVADFRLRKEALGIGSLGFKKEFGMVRCDSTQTPKVR